MKDEWDHDPGEGEGTEAERVHEGVPAMHRGAHVRAAAARDVAAVVGSRGRNAHADMLNVVWKKMSTIPTTIGAAFLRVPSMKARASMSWVGGIDLKRICFVLSEIVYLPRVTA